MGKKKDERKRREREGLQGAQYPLGGGHESHERPGASHEDRRHEGHRRDGGAHAGGKHEGGAPFAGIAATIARQMGTPVGRQMIAAGLMAAATAISKHDAKSSVRPTPPAPPTPPSPPKPPAPDTSSASPKVEPTASKVETHPAGDSATSRATGPFAGDTPEPPRSETNALPPEFTKVIDSVSVGLERLFAGFGKQNGKKGPPGA